MDAATAITDLTEISPQIRDVVVLDAEGAVAGTNAGEGRADALADGARRLVSTADEVRTAHGVAAVTQVEAATNAGSVFVVREGDRIIAATTTPEPTVGLVFYDLKTCLRSIDRPEPEPEPKPRARPRRSRKKDGDAAA